VIRSTQNGTSFFQFDHLAAYAEINHGIFTRSSGCSNPPFHRLNVGQGIGDNRSHVEKNRRIVAECMQAEELVFLDQVHGSRVLTLSRHHGGLPGCGAAQALIADAVVTDMPEKFLVIQVADCQSVLLYEPDRQVVANVHSGWRGSILNIIGRTVDAMQDHFGCRPDRVRAGIGPSLGPCCAEFVNYKSEIPANFWPYKDSNNHFDFWSISRDQLMQAGVAEKNIESSQICTRCRTDDFFSYRAAKTTGRFAAVIGLKRKIE